MAMTSAPPVLAPYQRGEKSRAEMAAEIGVSVGHFRRLCAQERAKSDGRSQPEIDEAVYLALTSDPSSERVTADRGWYDIASDRTSHDGRGCAVLVGDHSGRRLRRNQLGTGDHVRDMGGPTKYTPIDGVEGGMSTSTRKLHTWSITTPDGHKFTVDAYTRSRALKAARRQVGGVHEPLPTGTRISKLP